MRVLVAHNAYQHRGGEDVVVENECALLGDRGVEVDLLTVSNDDIRGAAAKARAALAVAWSDEGRRLVADRIRAFRPDVLQVHNFFPRLTPSIYEAARAAGVPIVQTLHNYRLFCASGLLMRDGAVCEKCVGHTPLPAVLHRCYRGSLAGSLALAHMISSHRRRGTWSSRVDVFLALSEFARGRFVAAGLPADRIRVKPNFAIDPGRLHYSDERAGALFVGRLSEEKGLDHLMHAWHGIDCDLRVVGGGPLAAPLAAAAPANVTFLGPLAPEAVRAEMARARCLVLPSTCYENFPLVVAEAYAAGLPVLASRIGSLAEIVRDRETGRLFAPADPADIARVVREALDRPQELARLSLGARQAFEERYSARAVGDQLVDLYRSLSGRRGEAAGAPPRQVASNA